MMNLDVIGTSIDPNDTRVLRLLFRNAVTDDDRRNLLAAINGLADTAAFLDRLADRIEGRFIHEAADCRAMAARLRG